MKPSSSSSKFEASPEIFRTPAAPVPGGIPVPYPKLGPAGEATLEALASQGEALVEEVADAGRDIAADLRDFTQMRIKLADEMREAMADAHQAFADLLSGELIPQLQGGMAELLGEVLPELDGSLAEAVEMATGGVGVAGLMLALTPPVQWALGIAQTIGELIDALKLNL